MDDSKQKSFEFANEAIKLIVALTTGVLAFTITFLKDIVGSNLLEEKTILIESWYILLSSIFFGIWTLFAIAGSLYNLSNASTDAKKKEIHIYNINITIPAVITIISFLIGIAFYMNFALTNFHPDAVPASKEVVAPRHTIAIRPDTVVMNLKILPDTSIKILKSPISKCCKKKQNYRKIHSTNN